MLRDGRTAVILTVWLVSNGWLVAFGQSSEKPPEIISLDELPEETDRVRSLRRELEAEIEAYKERMFEMNDWIYHHPEVGYQEFETTKLLGDELTKHGFEVTYGVTGIPQDFYDFVENRYDGGDLETAYVAKYKGKEETPVICFYHDSDALRSDKGPYHGCQHNQQGPAAVGSAVALANVMDKHGLAGSVWVVHSPAEEIPPSTKMALTQAGIFDKVDFLIRNHGTPHQVKRSKAGLGNCCMLIEATLYDFYGKPSHGTRAWQGCDALDAARLFLTAVDMLREHSEPTFRFMGTITRVGTAPNVTNDYVQVDHWVRNSDRAGAEAISRKVEQLHTIARAAAMATFTDVKIDHYASDRNGIETAWLQALQWYYTQIYGDASTISEELDEPVGWDESGAGAVNVPGVHIRPAVAGVPEVAGHSAENAAITLSPEGHEGLEQIAKIGTAVALRLVVDPELRSKVKEEFARWQDYGLANGMLTEDMLRKR